MDRPINAYNLTTIIENEIKTFSSPTDESWVYEQERKLS